MKRVTIIAVMLLALSCLSVASGKIVSRIDFRGNTSNQSQSFFQYSKLNNATYTHVPVYELMLKEHAVKPRVCTTFQCKQPIVVLWLLWNKQ